MDIKWILSVNITWVLHKQNKKFMKIAWVVFEVITLQIKIAWAIIGIDFNASKFSWSDLWYNLHSPAKIRECQIETALAMCVAKQK